ncbi:hypothetical protein MFIFM68171_08040 [Madurella fahalii]|uniref:Uncharacterized protein n=1 Tax=Madurella fahalii TaxID=1157608 RepID=A0ABQ0GJE4_9PEZI
MASNTTGQSPGDEPSGPSVPPNNGFTVNGFVDNSSVDNGFVDNGSVVNGFVDNSSVSSVDNSSVDNGFANDGVFANNGSANNGPNNSSANTGRHNPRLTMSPIQQSKPSSLYAECMWCRTDDKVHRGEKCSKCKNLRPIDDP